MKLAASSPAALPMSDQSRFQAFERDGPPLAGCAVPRRDVARDHDLSAPAARGRFVGARRRRRPQRADPGRRVADPLASAARHFAQVMPPFAYFIVIALLREADGERSSSYNVARDAARLLARALRHPQAARGEHRRRRVGLPDAAASRRLARVPAQRMDARAPLDLRRPDRRVHGPVARSPAA